MRLLCHHCRTPTATLLLVAKTGYADRRRPSCQSCYDLDDQHGAYYRNRFASHPLPCPLPDAEWVRNWSAGSTDDIASSVGTVSLAGGKLWLGMTCGRLMVIFTPHAYALGETAECPSPSCEDPCCRAIAVQAGRMEQEEIEALPVEEQAAIACGVFACSAYPVFWSDTGIDQRAMHLADAARPSFPSTSYAEGAPIEWAEAEARIRNGEVRP